MTAQTKSNLSKVLVIIPSALLLAAAITLALTSWKGAPLEIPSDVLLPFFGWAMIGFCVICIVCGIVGKRLSNYANTAPWVSTAATVETILGGLLIPPSVGFALFLLF
jgi:hypothetical protein